jgi:hypothetical protein
MHLLNCCFSESDHAFVLLPQAIQRSEDRYLHTVDETVQYLDSLPKLSDVNQQQLTFLYEQAVTVNTIIETEFKKMIETLIERKEVLKRRVNDMCTKEDTRFVAKIDNINLLIEKLKQYVDNLHTKTNLLATEKVSLVKAENDLHIKTFH